MCSPGGNKWTSVLPKPLTESPVREASPPPDTIGEFEPLPLDVDYEDEPEFKLEFDDDSPSPKLFGGPVYNFDGPLVVLEQPQEQDDYFDSTSENGMQQDNKVESDATSELTREESERDRTSEAVGQEPEPDYFTQEPEPDDFTQEPEPDDFTQEPEPDDFTQEPEPDDFTQEFLEDPVFMDDFTKEIRDDYVPLQAPPSGHPSSTSRTRTRTPAGDINEDEHLEEEISTEEGILNFEEEYTKALAWDPQAQARVGSMYATGIGIQQNDEEAIKWLRMSAVAGNSDGQCSLGTMLLKGFGVPKNKKEAAFWFNRASMQNHKLGQYFYAKTFKKKQERCIWFTNAARLGHVESQYELGMLYLTSDGELNDPKQAHKWLLQAAEQGYSEACYELGVMYWRGDCTFSTSSSGLEALKWFKVASSLGHSTSTHNIGLMHAEGSAGLTKDFPEAMEWFKKAADLGCLASRKLLDSF